MKKIMFIFALLFSTLGLFAQTDVYVGLGRIMTSEQGNAVKYESSFETNYNLGVRYFAKPRLSFDLDITRDTAGVAEWLNDHNFATLTQEKTYDYTMACPSVEYWFGDLRLSLGAPVFMSPDIDTKVGLSAGIGIEHALYKNVFWQTDVKYLHVQDFIVPVANVINWSFAVGYRF